MSAPWRYQARCPTVSGLSSRPAFLRRLAQRSPGLPAISNYTVRRSIQPETLAIDKRDFQNRDPSGVFLGGDFAPRFLIELESFFTRLAPFAFALACCDWVCPADRRHVGRG